ncbi:MAG: hypothetical protein KGJ49_12965 [Alphaproteobacteria bacterium]|nr:hypothetical protein [Alphaproteobacteria bacterium]
MKDELQTKLDSVFIKHEASKAAAAQVQRIAKNKEDECLEAFAVVRHTLIGPAMKEIGEYIKAKGYTYEISVVNGGFEPGRDRREVPASIRLTFLLGDRNLPDYEYPGFSVICEKSRGTVLFHESTSSPGRGGHSGPAGEVKISELTKELLQERILKVIAEIFA